MRRRNGDARSGSGHAVEARPILGVSTVRTTFLVDVPAANSRESESGHRADLVTFGDNREIFMVRFDDAGDDPDDDLDDDDFDEDEDSDADEDDDEDDEDDDEPETWQVWHRRFPLKAGTA